MTFEGGFLKDHLNLSIRETGNEELKYNFFGSKLQQHHKWTSVERLNNKNVQYVMTPLKTVDSDSLEVEV